jgi:hypothetical protein
MNTQQVTEQDLFGIINKLAIQVRNDLMESEVFEDSDTLEAVKSIIKLAQMSNHSWNFPYIEGDTYYTIEQGVIVESVWDEQSKEIYLLDDKEYFDNLDNAITHFRRHSRNTPKISLL